MKVINESYLHGSLDRISELVDAYEQVLIKRTGKNAIMMITLQEYNKLKKLQYQFEMMHKK
ncbi:MAG: hypothetical protein ACK5KR_02500 [Breznakia sp.]